MSSYVIYIMVIFIYYNMCESQIIKWKSNNFKTCIEIGIDDFIMEAAIKKTTNGTLIANSALFEISSLNNKCSVSTFDNCGNPSSNKCYCAKNTPDELILVYRITSQRELIGKVVTVNISCAGKEKSLGSEKLVIKYLTVSAVLKVNKQEYDLSKEFIYTKIPAEIEFCCDNSLTICKAHIERNYERIDNGSYCVYLNETSERYINYKMYSTCGRTMKKADMMFFPDSVEHVQGNYAEIWLVCLISALESFGAIAIAFLTYKSRDKYCFNKKNHEKKTVPEREIFMEQTVNSDGRAQRRQQKGLLIPEEDIEMDLHPPPAETNF